MTDMNLLDPIVRLMYTEHNDVLSWRGANTSNLCIMYSVNQEPGHIGAMNRTFLEVSQILIMKQTN